MSYRWIVGILVLAATAASLISGCGDGDEASADVTKAQFIKEAEAVCDERKKAWDAAIATRTEENREDGESKSFKEEEEESEAYFTDSLLPPLQVELEALEDLDAPEADEAKIQKMLQSRARGVKELEDKGTEALFDENLFRSFEKETKAYGLDCSLA